MARIRKWQETLVLASVALFFSLAQVWPLRASSALLPKVCYFCAAHQLNTADLEQQVRACYYVKLPGNKLTAHIDSATQVTNCRYEELEKYQSSACQTIDK